MKTPEQFFPELYNEELLDDTPRFSGEEMCWFAQDYMTEVMGVCKWTILSMNIGTGCGEMTERNSDSEDYQFCPYCGGKIERI